MWRVRIASVNTPNYPVTAPSAADHELPVLPQHAVRVGRRAAARRPPPAAAISSSRQLHVQLAARPRRTRPCRRRGRPRSGRRRGASGATWPAMKPWVAPEKRPSVRRATLSPRPSPTSAAVTCSISRMPGPPFGPSLRITTTSPGWIVLRHHGGEGVLLALEHARRAAVLGAVVAGELHDAALGREVAAQDREAAVRLDRVGHRADHVLARRPPRRASATSPIVCPVTVSSSSWSSAELLQPPDHERHAAGAVEVGGHVPAARLQVAQQRGAARRSGRSPRARARTPASCATASRCSTRLVEPPDVAPAAIAFSSERFVMIWLGPAVRLQHVEHEPAALLGDLALLAVLGRHHRAAHRRDAEHLERHRHRVGGELAAARAGARARRGPRGR